ncbi:MAG: hypothetical protein AAF203_05175, partial [Pseudomonadota bacterium]
KFPHFVKIELAIGEKDNPKLRPVNQTVVMRVEFPNNDTHLSNNAPPPPGRTNTPAAGGNQ